MSSAARSRPRAGWRWWLRLLLGMGLLAAWAPLVANAQPLVVLDAEEGAISSPAFRAATSEDLLWIGGGAIGLLLLLHSWWCRRRSGSPRRGRIILGALAILLTIGALRHDAENVRLPGPAAEGETRLWAPLRFGWREIEPDAAGRLLPPASRRAHPLGTDRYGRDVAARLVYGARSSLLVGFSSVLLATMIGSLLGGLAGYLGRWADGVVSFAIQVMICFPVLFLVLALQTVLSPSLLGLVILLGLTRWTRVAQMTRAEVLRLRRRDFVVAARGQDMSPLRVLVRHLLPNALGPIVVTAAFGVGGAILLESALSFLGLGVPAPLASWGEMLQQGRQSLPRGGHLVLLPGLFLFLTLAACHRLGDALREALDPRLGRREPR